MSPWNDERMERIIAVLLRSGVILSAAIVLFGGVCYLSRHGSEMPDLHVFHGTPESYRSVPGIIQAATQADCLAIIQLGLLILIATPVLRVAFSLVAFAMEGDRTYVVITSIVLAVLIYSLSGLH